MSFQKKILLIDDEMHIVKSLKRLLVRENYLVFYATSALLALEMLKSESINVVICDRMMPEMDGIKVLEKVAELSPDTARILLTGFATMDSAMDAINKSHVFSFLTKPWSNETLIATVRRACEHLDLVLENREFQRIIQEQNQELVVLNSSLTEKVKERTIQLEEALHEGIYMLAKAAEAKDRTTGDHVNRVKNMSFRICKLIDMSDERSNEIAYSSILHDVGKIHIPDAILNKPGPLDDGEWHIMKTHTIAGESILGDKDFYVTAREIARSHHENWDGTGYPDGLTGEAIPVSARIVAVADVFDALRHDRPYKSAWPFEKIIDEMKSLSGKKFDPLILEEFIRNIRPEEIKL